MLKRGNLVLLALSLILALATTFLILTELSSYKSKSTATNVPMSTIVVVKQSVPSHQLISEADVALAQMPAAAVGEGIATQLSQVVGQYTLTTWLPGQQVMTGMYGNGQAVSFSVSIPSGERAYTIPDSSVSGVDHLVLPGDHVDILISTSTATSTSGSKPSSPSTVIQNLVVLYVDQIQAATNPTAAKGQSGSAASGADTLTLAVTQQQAQTLADNPGQIHVLLRNPSDH